MDKNLQRKKYKHASGCIFVSLDLKSGRPTRTPAPDEPGTDTGDSLTNAGEGEAIGEFQPEISGAGEQAGRKLQDGETPEDTAAIEERWVHPSTHSTNIAYDKNTPQ